MMSGLDVPGGGGTHARPSLTADRPAGRIGWPRRLGADGPLTSGLGLGCSRLGSALGSGGRRGGEAAVAAALECGIAFFDTADVYGQGDSERILGRVLENRAARHAVVVTKAGFVLPAPAWVLRGIKPALRLAAQLRLGRGLAGAAAARRTQGYAQNFSPVRLEASLTGSLDRLQRERVDAFLLHSPPSALADDEAIRHFAERELRRGRIGAFGVSCDGLEEDLPWLAAGAVGIVEIPMPGGTPHSPAFVAAARRQGAAIVANRITDGVTDGRSSPVIAAAFGRAAVLADVVLLGTTCAGHVRANAQMADAALGMGRVTPPESSSLAGDGPIPMRR